MRWKLALLLGGQILLAAIVGAYAASMHRLVLREAGDRLQAVLGRVAAGIEDSRLRFDLKADAVQRSYLAVVAAGGDPATDPQLRAHLHNLVQESPALAQIVLTDRDGRIIAASDAEPGPQHRASLPQGLEASGTLTIAGTVTGVIGRAQGLPHTLVLRSLVDAAGNREGAIQMLVLPQALARLMAREGQNGYEIALFDPLPGSAMPPLRTPVAPAPGELEFLNPGSVVPVGRLGQPGIRAYAYALEQVEGMRVLLGLLREQHYLDTVWWPRVWPVMALAGLLALGLAGAALAALRAERRQARLRQEVEWGYRWLDAVFKATPDCIIAVDRHQRIVACNPATLTILGWPNDELVGRPVSVLVPAARSREHEGLIERFFRGKESLAYMSDFRRVHAVRKDGSSFPAMVSLGYFEVDGQPNALAVLRDMSAVERTNIRLTEMAGELSRQLELANSANRAKRRFLASMSHELRTPLNAVIGFAQMIEMAALGPLGNDRYVEYAANIRRSGEHLLAIITDVLDISRIEEGRFDVIISSVDCAEAWDLPVTNAAVLAANSGLTLHTDLPGAAVSVRADLRALQQCLINLLSNAVKFTPPGGRITCRTLVQPQGVEFVVEDTGIGIAAEDLPRLGRPFELVGDIDRAASRGAGLGLSITKSLVRLMGGEMTIDSRPGAGTRVSITLPREPAAADAAGRAESAPAPQPSPP
ncbi:MAG: hypothetical protein OHK0024_34960 [Thalassobaculales bacterium]